MLKLPSPPDDIDLPPSFIFRKPLLQKPTESKMKLHRTHPVPKQNTNSSTLQPKQTPLPNIASDNNKKKKKTKAKWSSQNERNLKCCDSSAAIAMVTSPEKKNKSSSESPPPTKEMTNSPPQAPSFSSLPYDVTLNILSRLSRSDHPTLSLVSKSFRSLVSSSELVTTRTLIDKTEKCFYLCLAFTPDHSNPCWYTLNNQQKLLAIPPLTYQYAASPTVVPTGLEIYIIGGYIGSRRNRYVFLLDCRTHRWRRLPNMLFPRGNAAAGLIQGKLYVFGGCCNPCNKNWGEIYDPETETWELLPPTAFKPDELFQKDVKRTDCFLGEEKIWCRVSKSFNADLTWCDLEDNLGWRKVTGLEGLRKLSPNFISVANSSDGGRRVTVMWVYKLYRHKTGNHFICHLEIWCAEILLERTSSEELFGTVEWSKMIYSTDDTESGRGRIGPDVCLATVAH